VRSLIHHITRHCAVRIPSSAKRAYSNFLLTNRSMKCISYPNSVFLFFFLHCIRSFFFLGFLLLILCDAPPNSLCLQDRTEWSTVVVGIAGVRASQEVLGDTIFPPHPSCARG
jgi:hypothetical protein